MDTMARKSAVARNNTGNSGSTQSAVRLLQELNGTFCGNTGTASAGSTKNNGGNGQRQGQRRRVASNSASAVQQLKFPL